MVQYFMMLVQYFMMNRMHFSCYHGAGIFDFYGRVFNKSEIISFYFHDSRTDGVKISPTRNI